MNGDVRFEGPTADKGLYRVTTHNGDIRVSLGAQANATVFVRTFGGDFSSDFPVTLPEGMSNRDGNKRFNFTLGGGSARVELQSFQGDIHVSRGPLPPERQRRRGAHHCRHARRRSRSPSRARGRRPGACADRTAVEIDVEVEIDAGRGSRSTSRSTPRRALDAELAAGGVRRDRAPMPPPPPQRPPPRRVARCASPAPRLTSSRIRSARSTRASPGVVRITKPLLPHHGAHGVVVGEHVAVETPHAEAAGQRR